MAFGQSHLDLGFRYAIQTDVPRRRTNSTKRREILRVEDPGCMHAVIRWMGVKWMVHEIRCVEMLRRLGKALKANVVFPSGIYRLTATQDEVGAKGNNTSLRTTTDEHVWVEQMETNAIRPINFCRQGRTSQKSLRMK